MLEGLGAGGEGDDRGWDGWMASLTQWTWVWVNSGSWWCHLTISSSVAPFSSCPPSFPAAESFPGFCWNSRVSSLHQVAKVLEFQLQYHSLQRNPRADLLQNGLVGSPCSPRDSQESSPTPQFKSINSSVLSLLYSPTLTSIHDYKKNHSLD